MLLGNLMSMTMKSLNIPVSAAGFAAIIVAYVGRLHPGGIFLSSLLMALLYLGGESGQMNLDLPSAVTGLFQGMLLFYLLAADFLINFQIRFKSVPMLKGAKS